MNAVSVSTVVLLSPNCAEPGKTVKGEPHRQLRKIESAHLLSEIRERAFSTQRWLVKPSFYLSKDLL